MIDLLMLAIELTLDEIEFVDAVEGAGEFLRAGEVVVGAVNSAGAAEAAREEGGVLNSRGRSYWRERKC